MFYMHWIFGTTNNRASFMRADTEPDTLLPIRSNIFRPAYTNELTFTHTSGRREGHCTRFFLLLVLQPSRHTSPAQPTNRLVHVKVRRTNFRVCTFFKSLSFVLVHFQQFSKTSRTFPPHRLH